MPLQMHIVLYFKTMEITTGKTLQEAFDRFVTLEYLAQTIINASVLGIPVPLKEKVLHFTMEQKIQGGGHPLSRRQRGGYLHPISRCCSSQCCCKNRLIRGEEKDCRSELRTFVKRAYDRKLFTSSSGSMSIRVRKDSSEETNEHVAFVISPTNIERESLGVADICYVSNDPTECVNEDRHSKNREASVTGSKRMTSTSVSTLRDPRFYPLSSRPTVHPSHTAEIHHTIRAMNPQINCVIVAQPQYTTAFCITGRPSCGVLLTALRRGNPLLLNETQVQEIDDIFDSGDVSSVGSDNGGTSLSH